MGCWTAPVARLQSVTYSFETNFAMLLLAEQDTIVCAGLGELD